MKEIEGIHYETKKPIRITIKNGKIKKIEPIESANMLIAPGFIDLQVNGYMGVDFNRAPLDEKEWMHVIQRMEEAGVTTFFPTIITNSTERLKYIFQENRKALQSTINKSSLVGGFHLEGPYISSVEGPRGAHKKVHVRPPDWEEFKSLQEASGGKISIITMSPEWEGAPAFIKKAVDSGVVIAIGHTAANSEQIARAIESGATLSTHLGNGAHLQMKRHPNYIWDQLAHDELWATVIGDGHHLPDNVLKVIHHVKKNRMLLISDSVALAGLPSGNYEQSVGGNVTLTPEGRLHLKENKGLLAGSAQNLLQSINRLVDHLYSVEDAVNMASKHPAKFLGIEQQKGIKEEAPADIVLLEQKKGKLSVFETYKEGVRKEK